MYYITIVGIALAHVAKNCIVTILNIVQDAVPIGSSIEEIRGFFFLHIVGVGRRSDGSGVFLGIHVGGRMRELRGLKEL